MDEGKLTYFFLSGMMVLFGYLIERYLKWAKLNNLNQILGIGIYWLKLYSKTLLLFGTIAFTLMGISIVLDIIIKHL